MVRAKCKVGRNRDESVMSGIPSIVPINCRQEEDEYV